MLKSASLPWPFKEPLTTVFQSAEHFQTDFFYIYSVDFLYIFSNFYIFSVFFKYIFSGVRVCLLPGPDDHLYGLAALLLRPEVPVHKEQGE